MAYKLNTFFVSVGEKYTKTLKIVSIRLNNKECKSSFYKLFIEKIELLKIINILKIKYLQVLIFSIIYLINV